MININGLVMVDHDQPVSVNNTSTKNNVNVKKTNKTETPRKADRLIAIVRNKILSKYRVIKLARNKIFR